MLGKTQIGVPVVGHGTWAAGGKLWGQVEDRACEEAIGASLERGVTLVDTAPVYGQGHSEELVGKAIKGRSRGSVVLSTKCGLLIDRGGRRSLRPEDIRRECDASLRRLGTDYIDILFCHWPDPDTPIEESVGSLMDIRRAGKIRAIGLSNHGPALIRRACAEAEIACLQDHYSLLNRDIEQEVIPLAKQLGLSIMAYGPLGGGVLTGKYSARPTFEQRDVRNFFYKFYQESAWSRTQELVEALRAVASSHRTDVAQVAIAWCFSRPGITTALAGAKSRDQAVANAAAGEVPLTSADMARLTEASDRCRAG